MPALPGSLIRRMVFAGQLQIVIDHQLHELLEVNRRLPAQDSARLARITHQQIDLGRAIVSGIYLDVIVPVEIEMTKSLIEKVFD